MNRRPLLPIRRCVARAVLPMLVAAASSGCLAMMGVSAPGNDSSGRCKQGLDMFESARCQPGQAGRYRVEFIRFELESFRKECKDAESLARLARIDQSCVPMYREAQNQRVEDRRQVRARFVKEVSELLLDPEYAPAADRYKDLEERAVGSKDPSASAALGEARNALAALARKHGIDPAHAKELQLW